MTKAYLQYFFHINEKTNRKKAYYFASFCFLIFFEKKAILWKLFVRKKAHFWFQRKKFILSFPFGSPLTHTHTHTHTPMHAHFACVGVWESRLQNMPMWWCVGAHTNTCNPCVAHTRHMDFHVLVCVLSPHFDTWDVFVSPTHTTNTYQWPCGCVFSVFPTHAICISITWIPPRSVLYQRLCLIVWYLFKFQRPYLCEYKS